jgi:hypothetical protein
LLGPSRFFVTLPISKSIAQHYGLLGFAR